MIRIGHEARRERRTARNPRYAPDFLERRLHPTAGVTTAVAAYYGQVATDPNPPGTPLPHPPFPPNPTLPPIDVPLPPIEPALPW